MNRFISSGYRVGERHLLVEACHSLSAWGYFQSAQMGQRDETFGVEIKIENERLRLDFTRDGFPCRQDIALTFTSCNYGDERVWFVCPSCARRVAKLFLPEILFKDSLGRMVHAREWRCRHCWKLSYLQRSSNRAFGLSQTCRLRAERVRARWLGDDEHFFIKRKWQHNQTHARRMSQYVALRQQADAAFVKAIGSMLDKDEGETRDTNGCRGSHVAEGQGRY